MITSFISAALLAPALASCLAQPAKELEALRAEASARGSFLPPRADELQAAALLFAASLEAGVEIETLSPRWAALGFELVFLAGGKERLAVIRESKARLEGRGLYALRLRPERPILVQAPHSFHDQETGTLAERLFLEGGAAAAAWNTVHRFSEGGDADLARRETSHFQAFCRAFVEHHGGARVIQLHGFERGKRTSPAGREAAVILSDGSRTPGSVVRAAVESLRSHGFEGVKLFPADIRELGGTNNAQGRLLRELGQEGFLHVELGMELRRRLLRDDGARGLLWRCLSGKQK
jgi:hypothetical protein